MRLVPDQTPEKVAELFEAYLKKISPKTVEVETHAHARRQAVDHGVRQLVRPGGRRGRSRKASASRQCSTAKGGSIPVVSTFQEELGIPSVLFGVGLPDENAHAPNEKLDLGNFHSGMIAAAYLYEEIARGNRVDA